MESGDQGSQALTTGFLCRSSIIPAQKTAGYPEIQLQPVKDKAKSGSSCWDKLCPVDTQLCHVQFIQVTKKEWMVFLSIRACSKIMGQILRGSCNFTLLWVSVDVPLGGQ